MKIPKLPAITSSHSLAPLIAGAFFLFDSCEKPKTTPPKPPQPSPSSQATSQALETKKRPAAEAPSFTFVAYNVRNWLEMKRWINRDTRIVSNKPEEEIAPLIDLVVDCSPDILGICEIGSEKDLADMQNRLKAAGLDLPHTVYAHGRDDIRRLALLSKYPVLKTKDHSQLTHYIDSEPWAISRGILDATLDTPIGHIRFLGAHLKSKRPIPDGDQALIRLGEATLLRNVIEDAIKQDPKTKLLVYGDINDTKRSDSVRAILGRKNAKNGLWYIDAKDSHGTKWTHHWAREDIYARLDWVFVSKALKPFIDNKNARIPDGPGILTPSDHRPLIIPILQKAKK